MPAAASASSPLPRSVRLGLSVLLVTVAAIYAHTLHAPFLYDDILSIPENPSLRSLWPLTRVLVPDVPGGVTVSGRPLLNLSFALNYAVSGTAPWSYHATNILIHAGAALLLFGLVRRTLALRSPGARHVDALALTIAALWALHPLATQAVTYTVQRAESLLGLFYLLTLYGFVRATTSAGAAAHRWTIATVAACACGMATKEVMVTAPLLALLYDRTFLSGTLRAALRTHARLHVSLAATWLVLAAALFSTGGNRGGTVGLGVGLPLWAYPLTQFEALATYLGLGVWPSPLIFEYGTFWVRDPAAIVPYAVPVLALIAFTLVAQIPSRGAPSGRWPAAGFLGASFLLILAPTSLAPGTIQMIVEHRMYLPLAAVLAALVLSAAHLAGPRALPALALGAVALALLTVRRNHDYRSPLALWHDTVAKRPLNPRAHEGLAEAFAAAGRFDDAIRVRRESVRLLPDESHYHYNLALTLAQAGREEDAVRHYRLALQLVSDEPRTHNNLAILLAKLGRPAEALPHYAAAVRLRPLEPLYHYNRGIAQQRLGQLEPALASYREALRLQPDNADIHLNLGTALVQQGRAAEALPHYARATALRPADVELALNHAGALLFSGRPADALGEFRRAEQLASPPPLAALLGRANALSALRRPAEAVDACRAVLARDPDHAHAHFKLANALLDLDRASDALPHYEAAVRLHPQDAEAHHNLGVAFARLERFDAARTAFDAALRLKPDYADARRSREQLRQLTGR